LLGALFAALGALASALPDHLVNLMGVSRLSALRAMFVLYGAVGCVVWLLYRQLPRPQADQASPLVEPSALGHSRPVVLRLAALFSLDSFAGGLVVNALMALWLFKRFDLPLGVTGVFFMGTGLLSALSQLAAPWLAQRVGLLNTMVFTHIPASLCLIAAACVHQMDVALGLLLLRSLLSQMDVPARSAFVMASVTPPERAAAASFTAVPRSLASALGPALGGAMFAAGWLAMPLVLCGVLKITYDLALWRAFRKGIPP
jgi:predicted MFS family arabinose efflux permease